MEEQIEIFIDYRTVNPNDIIKTIADRANSIGLERKSIVSTSVKPKFGDGITVTFTVKQAHFRVL